IAHPGGNITGVFLDQRELAGKLLELVKEVAPTVSRVGILWVSTSGPWQLAAARAAARKMGLDLHVLELSGSDDLDTALGAVVKGGSQALLELPSPLLNIGRLEARVSAFAIRHRLPTISMLASFARTGGLLAYGPNLPEVYRRVTAHVDKIL